MEQSKTISENKNRDIIKEIGKNILMGIPAFRRWRATRPRSGAYFTGDDAELERYAFSGLNMLRDHIGDISGKSILEIGAGDFLTSGLAMLGAGAESYGVIDNFPGDYTGAAAKRWYQAIEENWSRFYPKLPWAENIRAAEFPEKYAERLELIAEPIETSATKKKYEIICSFQVVEHISDIDAFAEMHNRLLAPGGVAIHRVDFGPHDCWFYYRDPLTYLQFSDSVWKMSGSNRGTPNRFRHHEFLAAFERANLQVEVPCTDNFKEHLINFDNLHPRFKKMPHESLLVGTAIYILSPKLL
ncbi:hypothetical protein BH18ACI1_BH18ACI1_19900 [soil metagenome]